LHAYCKLIYLINLSGILFQVFKIPLKGIGLLKNICATHVCHEKNVSQKWKGNRLCGCQNDSIFFVLGFNILKIDHYIGGIVLMDPTEIYLDVVFLDAQARLTIIKDLNIHESLKTCSRNL
jgi:hypothetical protein